METIKIQQRPKKMSNVHIYNYTAIYDNKTPCDVMNC